MSNIILSVENISKQYRLGTVGSGTLRDDFKRGWARLQGKEDPFLKVGAVNDRSQKNTEDYVWALRDINFDVKEGEVLGIIGKNGAGKSTLLKLLSRVTAPTTGVIKSRGRIASLLEVGTGFHHELTGRENIYLNGAILGMTKTEITSKLDEIIDFSGCERYIDTPTKRYSSGMTVRLAFAVAAHLEPEILVVDEVLAVGDADFQKKAIGKMQDISQGDGRTVLFVSHNMASIRQLCSRSILLENGRSIMDAETDLVVSNYLSYSSGSLTTAKVSYDEDNTKPFQILEAQIRKNKDELDSEITTGDSISLAIKYRFNIEIRKCHLSVIIRNDAGEDVVFFDRTDAYKSFYSATSGLYETSLEIPNPLLKPGSYKISLGLADKYTLVNDHKYDVIDFTISKMDSLREKRPGNLFIPLEWEMRRI
ncbi:ABC transporter ATP-binding protein [Leeuwenhoekiella sp. MAR_2009_132]|uniref:ABC transporter ATP-binding protein n=1 Tax=Leeuwenhoekiella sp. MAR_2009_132 TaxID=1392489 RepID=UPI00048F62C2|nr:ABC transporter ATP-binding protein [Leeuwenhoekiella sp. MAR_2009_132]